jgi:hypothetical protein
MDTRLQAHFQYKMLTFSKMRSPAVDLMEGPRSVFGENTTVFTNGEHGLPVA